MVNLDRLPVAMIDPAVQADLLAFHVGLESDAPCQKPRISEAEARREFEFDVANAMQQGAV